ncbi:hypothetical protein CEXT_237641 [Caerostris extrusa]|uniref:Uncharacterized protein n=1 Tax=Caerostris extrusa TaxID=172846 RepID=A0AAV4RR48_CAEEX|nr:hypothetical protein CEXT_237641 [Caerostris extrusa]
MSFHCERTKVPTLNSITSYAFWGANIPADHLQEALIHQSVSVLTTPNHFSNETLWVKLSPSESALTTAHSGQWMGSVADDRLLCSLNVFPGPFEAGSFIISPPHVNPAL